MALVSSDGRVDHRWLPWELGKRFPLMAFWINYHPDAAEYRLHFAFRKKMLTDGFVAHSFPIDIDDENLVEVTATKIMLIA